MSEFTMFAQPPVKPKPPVTEAPKSVPPVAPADSATVAVPAEKTTVSLKDAKLQDVSFEKLRAVTGELTDKQKDALMATAAKNNETARLTDLSDREKDAIVKRLAEQNRAGLYAEASSHDVTDADFDSLSDEEKWALFDKANAPVQAAIEASVAASKSPEAQQAGDVEALKQAAKVKKILERNQEEYERAKAEGEVELKTLQAELAELKKAVEIRKRAMDTAKEQFDKAAQDTPEEVKLRSWYGQAMERWVRGNDDIKAIEDKIDAMNVDFEEKFGVLLTEVAKK